MKQKNIITSLILCLIIAQSCSSQKDSIPEKATAPIELPTFLAPQTITERGPLYLSNDFGTTWRAASYNLPKDIQVSFIEKKGNELVIATDNKGIFLSEKNKTDWTNISEGLPNNKINALHITENAILAGVYQKGIYETTNNGKTWKSLNYNLPNLRVQSIIKRKKYILVGTDEGIFKLKQNEKNWIKVSEGVQILSFDYSNGKYIAGTMLGTLLSEDDGATWKWIHQKGTIHYTHWVAGSIVEMYISGDVFISRDNGNSWNFINYEPRKAAYVYEIVKLENYWMMSNNYGIHRSEDEGETWELIYPTEQVGFFDFFEENNIIYGGTRDWDEFRKRK